MAEIYSTDFTGIGNTKKLEQVDLDWVRSPASNAGAYLLGSTSGTLYSGNASYVVYTQTALGVLADCEVEADLVSMSGVVGGAGVAARAHATELTCYGARYSAGNVQLFKMVAGTFTQLGSNYAASFAASETHRVGVRCSGNQLYATWDGVDVIGPITDSAIASGYAAIRTTSSITNIHIDNFSVDNLAAADTTAPTLTSPSASATGATTASGSVSTNEANGTLYYLASANASESVATVKAGSSQAVTATLEQPVTVTGLTASTSYYLHFVHRDAAGNDSAVATSAQFTTAAANTSPSFTGPNIDNISGTEGVALTPVDVSAKFFDSESGLTFSAIGSWPAGVTVSSAGVISGTPTTAGTYASLQVRATDAGALTADSNAFSITVAAAAVPTITSDEFKNNTGTLLTAATIPKVWVIPFGTPDHTNLTTNGAGELVISEAGLSGDYLIVTANADGSEVGVSKATAS